MSYSQLAKMLKNIFGKFVKPAAFGECWTAGGLSSVDFKNVENHVDNGSLVIGFLTKRTITRLLREGDISPRKHANFFMAVKAFLVRAAEYLLKWCPLEDELLTHATWLDLEHRLAKCFLSVEYFVLDDIPTAVKESAGLAEDPYRVDVLWGYLRGVKKPGISCFDFDLLFKVAEVVMTNPHSNAGEEGILSH